MLVVGCIHGNECAGSAVTHKLTRRKPPGSFDLWVIHCVNPDGRKLGVRQNGRGVDLNRNFGSEWIPIGSRWDPEYSGPRPWSEPETRTVRRLVKDLKPELTIWYHQPQTLVRAWGQSVPAARKFARFSNMDFAKIRWPHGTAPNWQNHRLPGTSSFVVELAPGPLSDRKAEPPGLRGHAARADAFELARNLVSLGHRKRAAAGEVVLEIDDQEGVHDANGMDLGDTCTRRSPDGLLAGTGSYSRHAMAGAGREERAWVRGAQAGSASDLEALFRHHWPGAYRAAYLVVHDAAAAEDIAQEAFLSAVRALDGFDRGRPFGPWLHRIVVNRAIDWTRARALRREVGDEQLAVTPARREAPPDDLGAETMAALGSLSPDHRAVVVLRYVLDYSPGEIAELLELPRGTVNSRLRRGLDTLQERVMREQS